MFPHPEDEGSMDLWNVSYRTTMWCHNSEVKTSTVMCVFAQQQFFPQATMQDFCVTAQLQFSLSLLFTIVLLVPSNNCDAYCFVIFLWF
jgi:hypothetical protein